MAVQQSQPEEMTRLWEQVLSSVQGRLGSHQAFDTWFRPIVPREISPLVVELEVPNAFFVDWIHEHHLPTLRLGLNEVLGTHPEVRLATREAPASTPVLAAVPSEPRPAVATCSGLRPSARSWQILYSMSRSGA